MKPRPAAGSCIKCWTKRRAAGTVCDWSYQADSAEAAYDLIDRAMLEFETQRPRSKHIQVPIAQLEGPAATCAPPAGGAC